MQLMQLMQLMHSVTQTCLLFTTCSDYIRHKYQILLQFVTKFDDYQQETNNMIMKSTKRLQTFSLGTVIFCAFILGNVTGWMARPAVAAVDEPPEFAVFWEAWDVVLNHFVDQDKINIRNMTYGAIEGMLNTVRGSKSHNVYSGCGPPTGQRVRKAHSRALEPMFPWKTTSL
ncbi:MAG: hypothetical protein R2932_48730 [Caldilineaceae bacterium]